MYDDLNEIKNSISEEMGSTYVTISQAWDSENNYNTSNITLDMEIRMIDASIVLTYLSINEDGQLLMAGDPVKFRKDGNSYKPVLKDMFSPMPHRLAIASYLLKHLDHVAPPSHDKDWSIYHVAYKDMPMVIGVLNTGGAVFFNFSDKADLTHKYYDKQRTLKTKTKSLEFELEIENPVYGDQITGFPMKLDELSDQLDDAIELIMRSSRIPELQHKLNEIKEYLNLL